MASLLLDIQPRSEYWDKKQATTRDDWIEKIRVSTTVYVGNLSFISTEDILYEWFSRVGEVCKIVIGLNAKTKTPCGFAFVVYKTTEQANAACRVLSGMYINNRPVRVDMDSGERIEEPSRKFGRGANGMQWRDEFRSSFDAERGGEGGHMDYEREKQRLMMENPNPLRRSQSRGPRDYPNNHNPRYSERERDGRDGGDGYAPRGRGGYNNQGYSNNNNNGGYDRNNDGGYRNR